MPPRVKTGVKAVADRIKLPLRNCSGGFSRNVRECPWRWYRAGPSEVWDAEQGAGLPSFRKIVIFFGEPAPAFPQLQAPARGLFRQTFFRCGVLHHPDLQAGRFSGSPFVVKPESWSALIVRQCRVRTYRTVFFVSLPR